MSGIAELIQGFYSYLEAVIAKYDLLAVLITMSLESALIPIPSELVVPFAGFLQWRKGAGIWGVLSVALIATVANLLGSLGTYFIGSTYGRAFVHKYGKYLLISEKELDSAEKFFRQYGTLAVFSGRLLPAIRTVISLPAGIFRIGLIPFISYTLAGSIIWNLGLAYAGYILGIHWEVIHSFFKYLDLLILIAIVLAAAYFIRKRLGGALTDRNPSIERTKTIIPFLDHVRIVKFAAVGASGVFVNEASLAALTLLTGFHYLPAAIVSGELSIVTNFMLNDFWTFSDRVVASQKGILSKLSRLLRYNAVVLGGFLISLTVLWFMTEIVGLHYLVSNLLGIFAGFLWNYTGSSGWAWRRKNRSKAEAGLPQTR